MTQRLLARSRLPVIVFVLAALVATALPVFANLAGSQFDADDGNLVLDDETKDWINVPNLQKGLDLPTGQTDDSFGQGTKEDTAVPTIVSGQIPNNKSDLTRLYVANEKIGSNEYLYLAWERVQEPNGTTNMDFEFNQSRTLSANGVTPIRTAGDVLIKYDLAQGGVNPILGYHLWVTRASALADPDVGDTPALACQASNTFPCWGTVNDISGSDFEASINTEIVTDPIGPNAPRDLSVRTFGEAAIDLTDSGILDPNTCQGFGYAYLKSRSSDSFTAALKDFIAPIPVTIANCGTITINKETIPDGSSATFGITHTVGTASDPDVTSPFSLGDGGSQPFLEVQAGSYTVTESAKTGWDLTDLQCTKEGLAYDAAENLANRRADITIAAGDDVVCTFTNTARGTIIVEKQTDPDGANKLFDFSATNLTPTAFQLSDGQQQTYSNVLPGSGYAVGETVPSGWRLLSATCSDGSPIGNISVSAGETVTCTFTNQKLSRIDVSKVDDDDPAQPLQGAVFTLYNDNPTVGVFNGQDTVVQLNGQDLTCTTGANGECSFGDLIPGNYVVVETTTPEGYQTAAPQFITVAAGDVDAAIELTFTNDRLFKVIVLVCEKGGTDTLYPSRVSFDGAALPANPNSPDSVPAGIDETTLCGLSGTYVHDDVLKGAHEASIRIPQ